MSVLIDHLSGMYRCSCGMLYKDYTGLLTKCGSCRSAIQREYEQQEQALSRIATITRKGS